MSDESEGPIEASRPPDHSIMCEHRLVAYVWRQSDGVLRHGVAGEPICDVPFAEIVSFDERHETTMVELIAKSSGVDALLFKLGMEGLEIVAGDAQPNARLRRF